MKKDAANATADMTEQSKPLVNGGVPPGGASESARKGTQQTIFVCSPYRAASKDPGCRKDELTANVERARNACRILSFLGYLPLAPHLYFTQFLKDDDEKERQEGMELGLRWLEQADEVWMFGKTISEGMSKEIAYAKELDKPVRCFPEPSRVLELLLKSAYGKLTQDEQQCQKSQEVEGE